MKSMKTMKQRAQAGFTLIELMIVVAIIGILAAVAIPQYQDYVVRSKLAAAASSVASIQTAMAEYYQSNGVFPTPANLTANGVTIVSGTNAAISIAGGTTGVVTVTFAAALGNTVPAASTLIFTAAPSAGDSSIKWVATQTTMSGAAAAYVATKLNGS